MRVKQNYYDTLRALQEQGAPMIMTRTEAAQLLNTSLKKINALIRAGYLTLKENRITIGAVASYLCN